MSNLVPIEKVESKIYVIRGQRVMLDKDLAELYGVKTKALNQAVKRNIERFPEDFMFLLTRQEILRMSQFVTSSTLKFSKSVSAFTEHGILMLSSVLNSERAVQVNIQIMRAFVRLRQIIATNKEFARKLENLEKQVGSNVKDIRNIFQALRKMMEISEKPSKKIGFQR